MLQRIGDMPAGTIGFEAVGEVEDDDWERVVEPVLREEIAEGRKIRLLYVIGARAGEVEGEAMTADTGISCSLRDVLRARGRSQRRGLDQTGNAWTFVSASGTS